MKGDGKGKGGYNAGQIQQQQQQYDDDGEDYDESSEEEDTDDEMRKCDCKDADDEEKHHFLDVCFSFMKYQKDAMYDVDRLQDSINALDANDMALWEVDGPNWIKQISVAVQINARFLSMLPSPDVSGVDLGPDAEQVVRQVPSGHHVASRNSSKVRSTLRQFVRDWAAEGKAERLASYGPLIEALWKRMPAVDKKGQHLGNGQGANGAPRVLCPGCGLGRLPFDLARMGYDAQGNEFSYHMLLGSHLILNRCTEAKAYTIYPFILSTGNRRGKVDHLRPVKIPEEAPSRALPRNSALSMTAGEFVEVYKDQPGEWDALLTAFFLDTAKNVLLYIRTFAMLIREGGCWINLGPLLFHYAEAEHDISIELAWEEVRPMILRYFTIDEEEMRLAHYTTNPSCLYSVKYRCVFFVATRNSEPVTGTSNPVFPAGDQPTEGT